MSRTLKDSFPKARVLRGDRGDKGRFYCLPTYDDSIKTISLNCIETTDEMVTTIKILKCDESSLQLDFDGETRIFTK